MTHPISSAGSTAGTPQSALYESKVVWQLPIRMFHWSFAGSVVVLFATGLYINAPAFTAGGVTDSYLMGWTRWLHIAAAMVFTVAFLWRIVWFWIGNRYARSGFPFVWRARWWRDLFRQVWDYLRFDFGTPHMGHNALAGLAYTIFAIGLGWGQIFTGGALLGESNPGGFWDLTCGWVIPLLGSSFRTHMWHHLFAWGFAVFVVLHLYIVLLDDRQYHNGLISSMISGRKFFRKRLADHQHQEDGK